MSVYVKIIVVITDYLEARAEVSSSFSFLFFIISMWSKSIVRYCREGSAQLECEAEEAEERPG